MDGILCIDKPEGMTSFLCVAVVRRLLGIKKVGHAGTLDPNATGVLPLLVGRGTKLLDHLPCHDKCYIATLRFGAVSDTLDVWGKVEETHCPLPTLAAIEEALPPFRGSIMQIPPMTSALKKDGVRLYELARQGVEVEREARPVTIYALDLLEYNEKEGLLTLSCRCSSGTYIRTLCDDLGRALGCGAVMTSLRRTMAAGFPLTDCITLDEAKALAEAGTLTDRLLPLENALSAYPAITVSAPQAARFRNGGALDLVRLRTTVEGTVRVYDPDGNCIALGTPEDGMLKMTCLLQV